MAATHQALLSSLGIQQPKLVEELQRHFGSDELSCCVHGGGRERRTRHFEHPADEAPPGATAGARHNALHAVQCGGDVGAKGVVAGGSGGGHAAVAASGVGGGAAAASAHHFARRAI